MKYILLLLITIGLFSCTMEDIIGHSEGAYEYRVIIIEDCEYVGIYQPYYSSKKPLGYAHKGNCKNSIHKY